MSGTRTSAGQLVAFAIEHDAALVISRGRGGRWSVSMEWDFPTGLLKTPRRAAHAYADEIEECCAAIIQQIEEIA